MGDWILDPVYPSLTVSNLILVKEGDKTKVNGQIELKSDANSANIGVNLSFLNEKGDKIGFIVISGDYKAGISYFEIAGDGDFKNYATANLFVGAYNGV